MFARGGERCQDCRGIAEPDLEGYAARASLRPLLEHADFARVRLHRLAAPPDENLAGEEGAEAFAERVDIVAPDRSFDRHDQDILAIALDVVDAPLRTVGAHVRCDPIVEVRRILGRHARNRLWLCS